MVKPGLTVLQVIPELNAGGAERTTLEIVEALVKNGDRAIVVSEGGRLVPELERLGGKHIEMPVRSKSLLTLLKNRARLIELIDEEDVDIVHARSRAPAWSALWACRATLTPFVTTYHGAYSGTSAPKTLFNSVMARGDRVIANSGYIADHIRNRHGVSEPRMATIPRGADLRIFDPAKIDSETVQALRKELAGDRQYLFTLPGRLTEWKGQMVLLDALAMLSAEERAKIAVALVGDAQGRTGYVDTLKARIRSAGLDDVVRMPGHYSDMPTLYAASDLVLAPSVRPEAFGRVAVEASAMGKPVLASDHGGQRETVRHEETGWLTPPGDALALAEAMRTFLALSDEQKAEMGAAAQGFAREHFTTERLQRETLDVYRRVLTPLHKEKS